MGLLYLYPCTHSIYCLCSKYLSPMKSPSIPQPVLTRVSQPLTEPVLHGVRSSASSFNLSYHLISLKSYNIRLRLLPRLPVPSILPSFFPSITYFRGQFLRLLPRLPVPSILPSIFPSITCFRGQFLRLLPRLPVPSIFP